MTNPHIANKILEEDVETETREQGVFKSENIDCSPEENVYDKEYLSASSVIKQVNII